jgi:hypothetical protein
LDFTWCGQKNGNTQIAEAREKRLTGIAPVFCRVVDL